MTPVPTPNWCHPAQVVRVIDGDTMVVRLDLGRYGGGDRVEVETTIRVAGLYCPELREPGGHEALARAAELLIDTEVVVQTRKPNPRDPYGRVVADIWLGSWLYAELMIEEGHGHA